MAHPLVPAFDPAMLPGIARDHNVAPQPPREVAARLRFALPRTSLATVVVIDANGRTVRTLQHGELEPGEHVCSWDGRDDMGTKAATGSYTLRLEVVGGVLTSRVVAIR